jgi:hypothetical protein
MSQEHVTHVKLELRHFMALGAVLLRVQGDGHHKPHKRFYDFNKHWLLQMVILTSILT